MRFLMCSLLFLWLTVLLFVNGQLTSINVGILIPRDGEGVDKQVTYNISAGAVVSAINRTKELKIYDPSVVNITFTWYFTQCDESVVVGYATRLIKRDNVSAILGPVCPETSFVAGALSSYKNIPTFLWGLTSPGDFYTPVKYPTTMPFAGTVRGMFIALSNVLEQFNWTKVGYVYSTSKNTNAVCSYFSDVFAVQSNLSAKIEDAFIRHILEPSVEGIADALVPMKKRARIIVSCLETKEERRNYMLAAIENGMVDADYVHLFVQVSSTGFGEPPFWVGTDGRDKEIKEASKTILLLDKYLNTSLERASLLKEIANNIYQWPFYCKTCPTNQTASNLAIYLGDSMLAYLWALNKTYVKFGDVSQLKNTTAIMKNFNAYIPEMPSISGSFYILNNGLRAARYTIMSLNTIGEPVNWAYVRSNTGIDVIPYTPLYDNTSTQIWATRNFQQPLTVPKCGYLNQLCPASPLIYTIIVVGGIIVFFAIIGLLVVLIFLFQKQQRKRLNALWQIPYVFLQQPEEKQNGKSTRSIQSTTTSNTTSSYTSIARKNTDKTEFFIYNQKIIVARKYAHHDRWSEFEEEEFRKMRSLDHANLNRFLGVAVLGNINYIMWEYCERGSLMEVIKAHSFRIDSYIMTGMIKNIIEGLFYIHNSHFQQHGALSVYRCVVGDRFEVKIQMYGMSGLKSKNFRRMDDHSSLFVAPEHLHGQQNEVGSQTGDIYSLGIICSVILTMKPAFDCDEEDEKLAAEVIRSVAKGKYPPVRPSLEVDGSIDVNHELISLVKKMWSEHPPERPQIDDIRQIMTKRISTSKSSNLMDYMFALMENNAAELEQDVQQRTAELLEEQKKADVLLYRMMPKQAADSLKLGQHVVPEVFESATVFFSDIVSFTVLASKSTPLQIINFLNDVYTLADSVIDNYDVYKVETIGDGMHVVSGVPKRNGTAHVKEIANMSIDFQRAVKTLKLSHIPDQQIQMRVGVHSGACVAGIVGMTSPRYIVFGDTVNVAAKMEASGKAGRIHISGATKALIKAHYPTTYSIYDRGETLIKGIGAMHTHWIVPPEEVLGFQP